jgi:hypothetical protein
MGWGLIISSNFFILFREGENAQRTLQQAGAVEPSKQGIIYNHQASTALHQQTSIPDQTKAGVKFRVKPQAVGISGIRARMRQIVGSMGPIPLKHVAQGPSHVTEGRS